MSAKRLHLIRHAQSLHNAAALAVPDEELIKRDPALRDAALSPLGHQQARALADEMTAIKDIELIVISPFTRAIQTAQHAFGDADIPRLIHDLPRERLDSFCDVGRSPAQLAQDFPTLDFAHLDDPWWYHDPAHDAPFTQEPWDVLDQRINGFVAWLQGRPENRIAIVAHSTFLRIWTGTPFANAQRLEITL
ncbi:histidine phosphatase family protein [Yoonia sp.]|uniref:histidine phosphatase family protein n=1 Tax=Yoonia sp. TaxID=2212373 RepID=UPI00391D2489